MRMLTDILALESVAPSPFRKGSFDLLLLLSLQESVHRVLRNFKDLGEKKDVSYEWLRDFYTNRVSDYFDGNGEYGRGDDFLEELLLTSPSMKTTDDGKMGLVDPHGIAEEIIRTRGDVAREWKEKLSNVNQDHIGLRKSLLSHQMSNWDAPVQVEDFGAFE